MKIRSSFVSNSSSSSFCIMGVLLDCDSPEKAFSKWDGENSYDFFRTLEFREGIDELADYSVVGMDVNAMKDNETKTQFRHRVFEELQKYGYIGDESAVDFRVDGGYC